MKTNRKMLIRKSYKFSVDVNSIYLQSYCCVYYGLITLTVTTMYTNNYNILASVQETLLKHSIV